MKKLGIGIMVKNESAIIERCLSSIIPLKPDVIVITDTGSNDDTILKIALFLHKYTIPFKIYQEQFKDFAYNRSLLLHRCEEEPVDYILMIDADEVLIINKPEDNEFKNSLSAGIYDITITDGTVSYRLPRLTQTKPCLYYVGVTHEYLEEGNLVKDFCPHISIATLHDSSRRKSNQKYLNDIALLEKALAEDVEPGLINRYQFYLAQSYYCNNEWQKAYKAYEKRIVLGGWKEEIFYSYYQIGNICAQYNSFTYFKDAVFNYTAAYEELPSRAESLYALEQLYRESKYPVWADRIKEIRRKIPKPATSLFLLEAAYD